MDEEFGRRLSEKYREIKDCIGRILWTREEGNQCKQQVIEKSMKGVYTSRMKTQGWLSSTTTYVVFRNVKVPRSHIIGKEGMGFKPLMHNVCNIYIIC